MGFERIQLQAFQLSESLYPSYQQSIGQARQSQLQTRLEAVTWINM